MQIHTKVQTKLNEFNIQPFHSAILATDTTPITVYPPQPPLNWKPDYWIIVARLTAGYINIFPGANKGQIMFRLAQSGEIVYPTGVDSFTIETVGATGFYSLYAVRGLDGFKIVS